MKINGNSNVKNQTVCDCHFEDVFIKRFIRDNSTINKKCHYCSKDTNVIELPILLEFIVTSIKKYYGNIEDQNLPLANSWLDEHDNERFPYRDCQGLLIPNKRNTYDIDELLYEVGLVVTDERLYRDIRECFDDTITYCLIEALYETKEEELSYKWKQFCRIVKDSRRYTFFKMSEFSTKQYSDNGLVDILSELGNTVINAGLISYLEPNKTGLYRCRVHENNENISTIDDLASPPNNYASNNRMSPVGISMFYGAFYAKTAYLEIANTFHDENSVSIGYFDIKKTIKVIDFSGLFHTSIFSNEDYNIMNFLKSFVFEISKPINPRDKSIEYIPTQIITEYFRYVFKTQENDYINGLIYRSATKNGGLCCVLFFDKETCPEYLTLSKHITIKNKDKAKDIIANEISWESIAST